MKTSIELFEIGQVIEWKIGNVLSKGIIRDDDGSDMVEVVCFEINGNPTKKKLKVIRDLLCIIKG